MPVGGPPRTVCVLQAVGAVGLSGLAHLISDEKRIRYVSMMMRYTN